MSENRTYLDFEISKEHWNKYTLSDGSKLKTRVILKSAWFTKKDGKNWNECLNCGHFISNHLNLPNGLTICMTHQNTIGNCKCRWLVRDE